MKTISVKQVAEALELTTRAVVYRLEKGQLKGTQQPNAFGKQEWRVYPTKEIIEGLKKRQGSEIKSDGETGDESLNFSPDGTDIVDADQVVENEQNIGSPEGVHEQNQASWREVAKETLKGLAEELVRPLGETIRAQQDLLAEKDRIIAEKDQQLKLLPDYQKQADEERQAAQLRALEVNALKKQIEALQAHIEQQETVGLDHQPDVVAAAEQVENAEQAELDRELDRPEEAQTRTDGWRRKLEDVEKTVLPDLSRRLEAEQQARQAVVIRLEEERAQVELAKQRARELEERLQEEQRSREAEALRLEQEKASEIERLQQLLAEREAKEAESKSEGAAQQAVIREQLSMLTTQLQEIQKTRETPWWKKLLGMN